MIVFKEVLKKFGDREVLKRISFEVLEAEIFFILGTSGTGKSVALKSIVGLQTIDDGEIWVDGENITDFTESDYFRIRKKCGMVFQQPALIDSLSVFENVAYGLRCHYQWVESRVEAHVNQCLEMVSLTGMGKKMPQEIPYGLQKRVSLARTLALQPKILLFDEPTTGLEISMTNSINELITSLSKKQKTTCLVVSHDVRSALEIADRILVLDQGRIVSMGSPMQLRESEAPLVKEFLLDLEGEADSTHDRYLNKNGKN